MASLLIFPRQESSSLLAALFSFTTLLLYGLILLRQRQILDWLKSKITYPRTGYVSPPPFAEDSTLPLDLTKLSLQGAHATPPEKAEGLHANRKWRFLLTLALALAAVLLIFFFRNPWLCSAAGLLIALAVWFSAHHEQRVSSIVLAGLPCLGVILSVFLPRGIVGPQRVACFLAGAGALFVFDGALTLFRYLRANPVPNSSRVAGPSQ
jgi:hypothetical protein